MAKPWLVQDRTTATDFAARSRSPNPLPPTRPVALFRRRHVAVRASRRRLSHAHGATASSARGCDWRPTPKPRLLWVNTGMLILSSVALQRALHRRAPRTDGPSSGQPADRRLVSAFAFLAGQLMVWRQLAAAGYFFAANPANSLLLSAHRRCTACTCWAAWLPGAGPRPKCGTESSAAEVRPERGSVHHLLALPARWSGW